MNRTEQKIQEQLFAMADPAYRQFHSRLMPTVAPERVIGVRTPLLRQYARGLAGSPEAEEFLHLLPHHYYEENNLHGFLIEQRKTYRKAIEEIDAFLPYVDNWATCDGMCPPVLKTQLPQLAEKTKEWMSSGQVYTVRYGIEVLMRFFLDEAFLPEYPTRVAAVKSEEYYINMMIAWYFATALAKQWQAVIPWIEENRLEKWVHNKTIQKAVESRRISAEQKEYLRKLKRK